MSSWGFYLPLLRNLRIHSVDVRDVSLLPVTLKSLEITGTDTSNNFAASNAEPVQATEWPPNLSSFTCPSGGTSLRVAGAPPALTRLRLTGSTFGVTDIPRVPRILEPWNGVTLAAEQDAPLLRILEIPTFELSESALQALPSRLTRVIIKAVALDGSSLVPGTREISSFATLAAMFRLTKFPYTLICKNPDTVSRLSHSFKLPDGLEELTLPRHNFSLLNLPHSITKATDITSCGYTTKEQIFPPNLTHLAFQAPETHFPAAFLLHPNKLKYLSNAQISLTSVVSLHPSLVPSEEAPSSSAPPVLEELNLPEDGIAAFKHRFSHIETLNVTFNTTRLLEGLEVFPKVLRAKFTGKFYLPPQLSEAGFGEPLESLDLSAGALLSSSLDEVVMPVLPDSLTELKLTGASASRLIQPIYPLEHTIRWFPKRIQTLILQTKAPGAGYSSHDYDLPYMPYLVNFRLVASYISPTHVKSLPAYLDVIDLSEDRTTLEARASGNPPHPRPDPKPVRPIGRPTGGQLAQPQAGSSWSCNIM